MTILQIYLLGCLISFLWMFYHTLIEGLPKDQNYFQNFMLFIEFTLLSWIGVCICFYLEFYQGEK